MLCSTQLLTENVAIGGLKGGQYITVSAKHVTAFDVLSNFFSSGIEFRHIFHGNMLEHTIDNIFHGNIL